MATHRRGVIISGMAINAYLDALLDDGGHALQAGEVELGLDGDLQHIGGSSLVGDGNT